jgi:hypothetical protein
MKGEAVDFKADCRQRRSNVLFKNIGSLSNLLSRTNAIITNLTNTYELRLYLMFRCRGLLVIY